MPVKKQMETKNVTPPPRDAATCTESIRDRKKRSANIIRANAPCDTTIGSARRNNSFSVNRENTVCGANGKAAYSTPLEGPDHVQFRGFLQVRLTYWRIPADGGNRPCPLDAGI